MTLPYRRSAQADRCRWPEPAADGRCRYCGWALTPVRRYDAVAGTVTGHYRHRRPGLPLGMGAQASVPDPDEPVYPHESAQDLALSEDARAGEIATASRLSVDRTPAAQGTYPQPADITLAFVQRAGAGDRLFVPTVDEWAAWKTQARA